MTDSLINFDRVVLLPGRWGLRRRGEGTRGKSLSSMTRLNENELGDGPVVLPKVDAERGAVGSCRQRRVEILREGTMEEEVWEQGDGCARLRRSQHWRCRYYGD